MAKIIKPYLDAPRFDLQAKYESDAKALYSKYSVNIVKLLGIKMLNMLPGSNAGQAISLKG